MPESLHEAVTLDKADPERARQHFEQAEEVFRLSIDKEGKEREKGFEEAAKHYTLASRRSDDPTMLEDALWMTAESHFFANNYPKASLAYGGLMKRFPTSRYVDRVDQRRFTIAQYWLALKEQDTAWDALPNLTNDRRPVVDTFGYAVKNFERIRFDSPTGKLADDATMASAVAHFEREKWGKADELFTDLRENFPASEHLFRAQLLGLKCKLAKYQGPDYDGSILDDCEQLIQDMLRNFPRQSEEYREFLEESFKDIRLKKAERDYAVAQFYDRRHEYGAARIYYNAIRENYADTNLALEAESRLAQIADEPDTPEQPMEWLSNAFPDIEDKPLLKR